MPTEAVIVAAARTPFGKLGGGLASVPAVDLASDLDLPLGVVRILISDLRERGLVTIHRAAPAGLADVNILKEVADGLRRI